MLRRATEFVRSLDRPGNLRSDWAHELMSVLFAPLARALHRLRIVPNAVTVTGTLLAMFGGALVALDRWKPAAVVILVSGFMDGVDGLLARESRSTSRLGAFLDSVLDRWSDVAFYIGLLIWYLSQDMEFEVVLVGCALASSLLVSYTRARAEGIGARCGRGVFTRLERFVALLVGLVLNVMTWSLWVIVVLSTFTALQRLFTTFRYVRDNPEG